MTIFRTSYATMVWTYFLFGSRTKLSYVVMIIYCTPYCTIVHCGVHVSYAILYVCTLRWPCYVCHTDLSYDILYVSYAILYVRTLRWLCYVHHTKLSPTVLNCRTLWWPFIVRRTLLWYGRTSFSVVPSFRTLWWSFIVRHTVRSYTVVFMFRTPYFMFRTPSFMFVRWGDYVTYAILSFRLPY